MNVWANARRACHGLTRRDLHRYDCSAAKILRDTACGQIPTKRLRARSCGRRADAAHDSRIPARHPPDVDDPQMRTTRLATDARRMMPSCHDTGGLRMMTVRCGPNATSALRTLLRDVRHDRSALRGMNFCVPGARLAARAKSRRHTRRPHAGGCRPKNWDCTMRV